MAPLIFADQFLQISTLLPSKFLYGLGEHRGPLLHSMDWSTLTLWARDVSPTVPSPPVPMGMQGVRRGGTTLLPPWESTSGGGQQEWEKQEVVGAGRQTRTRRISVQLQNALGTSSAFCSTLLLMQRIVMRQVSPSPSPARSQPQSCEEEGASQL